jgi:hypothetical protein
MNGHDRNPVRRSEMNITTESERNASAPEVPQPKTKRISAMTSAFLLKRAKGATRAEIMAATEWQAHTERGFVSILGNKGGETIESSKNAAGERTYKIAK